MFKTNFLMITSFCLQFQWVEAMQKFTEAAELIDAESRMKKTM